MNVVPLSIPEVLRIEPRVFSDSRGEFFESFNRRDFQRATGLAPRFVQENHSVSGKNVLRGLHYQIRQAQGKLIRVVAGAVFDVAVDIRRGSPTFGCWTAERLTATERRQLWIPPGFAHGFLALSDRTELVYLSTAYWAPEHERCLCWDDPRLAIDWPQREGLILSAKDRQGQNLADAELPRFRPPIKRSARIASC
ncbi:MAG TPA: dTDP-4-dehydrorhamnose 3,5-epimerase [Accumulibacter sp.]|nr:dTDP-4-dehydrorhamnose 3,5-epimerase [Accumulibacter sp.]HMW18224.1 dTDP-4-dehydrorhamnose 3,5-epimerase [Accumulibacter sp.]HMY05851.1 dTDP-4-dehydrorhamnose 3,5-epimerase [Accumulibacter sp.]HNC18343.1 dTDP-4-dehydrorhamnose 3,5-epimerase [Accumulibacter sp.]HND80915.1 dTDP-4-dehydrorhamnose 3,5-epimerase [Accumulibacter sp.]